MKPDDVKAADGSLAAYSEASEHQHPIATTGLLHDGDGTYRCDLCGETFNGRYLHHYCARPAPPQDAPS